MQNKSDNIIIFTAEHKIGGTLKVDNANIQSDFRDPLIELGVKNIINSLNTKNPSVNICVEDSTGASIIIKEVLPDDAMYPNAVKEEINRHGMTAALASDKLLKLLDWVTKNIPKEELEIELGNFLVMRDNEVEDFLDGLKEVYDSVSN